VAHSFAIEESQPATPSIAAATKILPTSAETAGQDASGSFSTSQKSETLKNDRFDKNVVNETMLSYLVSA
jgi:hypothetical protein